MKRLALLLLLVVATAASAADVASGKTVFRLCASCHEVGPSARAGFGPQLNGLFGRRAAGTSDFKYSEALRRSGIVWSDATLAAFLKDPQAAVPGTKMRFWGLADEKKLADLLAYLETFQTP